MIPLTPSELFPLGTISVALAFFVLGFEMYLWPRKEIPELINRATLNGIPSIIASAIMFTSTMLFQLPAELTSLGYVLWGYSLALMLVGTTLQFIIRRRKNTILEELLAT